MNIPFIVNPDLSEIVPYIGLYSDNWDDYHFRTLYSMYYYDETNTRIFIGTTKILHVNEKITSLVLPKKFNELNDDFCSLGQNLSFYERLEDEFPNVYIKILEKLNDVAFFDGIRDKFENHIGLKNSLTRLVEADKAYNEAKKIILNIPYQQNFKFKYNCLLDNAKSKHSIYFNFDDQNNLPSRIISLVGKNGTGKTQLLANLALDLSGLSRKKLQDDVFIPSRPHFSKVIAISYSIFDKFTRPQPTKSFSYKYCGLKDENGRLISGPKIVDNYTEAINIIIQKNRHKIWFEVISSLLDSELTEYFYEELFENSNYDIVNYNKNSKLSSGQSFLMYVITEVIANIKPNSLLLFDEPEMHLHPNAISNLVRMLDNLINKYDSYAVIATHSPIIIQEIPSRYVKVLDRQGSTPMIYDLPQESFGENIEILTQEVFKTKDVDDNYKFILKKLSKDYDYQTVLSMFNNLSLNAKSYLIGMYNK